MHGRHSTSNPEAAPTSGYSGPAQFTYTIDDAHGGTSTATANIAIDHPPVANADTVSTNYNTAVSIAVLANDSDADGDTLTVTQVNGQAITAGGAAVTVVVQHPQAALFKIHP